MSVSARIFRATAVPILASVAVLTWIVTLSPAAHGGSNRDDPETCLRYFLDTRDQSVWDQKRAFEEISDYYIRTLGAERRRQFDALVARIPAQVGNGTWNQAWKRFLTRGVSAVEVLDRQLDGDVVTLDVMITLDDGSAGAGYWKLLRKDGKWFLFGYSTGPSGERRGKEAVLDLYRYIEAEFGWAGVLETIERSVVGNESPGDVARSLMERH